MYCRQGALNISQYRPNIFTYEVMNTLEYHFLILQLYDNSLLHPNIT